MLVSLVQEDVVGIHLCVHPVDVAGENIDEDQEKYGTKMRPCGTPAEIGCGTD